MKAAPQHTSRAVMARISATQPQQAKVKADIVAGRPLDAEDEPERKLAFIQREIGVNRDLAARIANYQDPRELPLTPAQLSGAESLQGRTSDFVPARFLDVARAASRSVGRVLLPDLSPEGTGFMAAPGLLLTNNHVIPSREAARGMFVEFNFETTINLDSAPVARFALDPGRLYLSDPKDDLDYALVAIGRRVAGQQPLEDFGYLPLIDHHDKHIKAMFVNIIQHPEGRPKEIVLRENRILHRTANTLIYGADTLNGSSGSPVFNDSWEVIALHHWGSPSRALGDDDGGVPEAGNEGIRISSIVQQLRLDLKNLDQAERRLVEEAINPRFRHPSALARLFQGETVGQRPGLAPVVAADTAPHVAADGTVTWTIPLTVSVRLGEPAPAAPDTRTVTVTDSGRATGAEGLKPDTTYSNRKGYNRDFLGRRVGLPTLSAALKQQAAKNLEAKAGTDPFVVKYQNFSLVMNGARRLAFYTAVNIDGASVVRINRETGAVTHVETDADEGAEASEKWYEDRRIAPEHRSDQKLYDHPALKNFQRGHLVKRTDPSWGTVDRAVRGQADTFHFTNCAPQHELFNPKHTQWAGLENWITKGSDDRNLRVSVFCGPVFADDDPQLSYIQVPRRYWKIVVRVEDDKLLATGIVLDQSEFVAAEVPGPEDLPALPARYEEFQYTIKEIETLTGLNFGRLREHDTFDGGPEGRRRIERVEDISLYRRKR